MPSEFLSDVTEDVLETLLNTPDENLGWLEDTLSYIALVQAKGFPPSKRTQIIDKLRRAIPHKVEQDSQNWSILSNSPINLAPTPDSPLAQVIHDTLIHANLDYDIDQQLPDGTWALDWSWKDAEPEWKSVASYCSSNKMEMA